MVVSALQRPEAEAVRSSSPASGDKRWRSSLRLQRSSLDSFRSSPWDFCSWDGREHGRERPLTGSENLLAQIWASVFGAAASAASGVLLVASVRCAAARRDRLCLRLVFAGMRHGCCCSRRSRRCWRRSCCGRGRRWWSCRRRSACPLRSMRAGGLLLGGAAILWLAAGRFAIAFLRADPSCDRFLVWWLFTMAGSFAVFLVADLASFYLAYALVSFSAFGLVAQTIQPRRGGQGRCTSP